MARTKTDATTATVGREKTPSMKAKAIQDDKKKTTKKGKKKQASDSSVENRLQSSESGRSELMSILDRFWTATQIKIGHESVSESTSESILPTVNAMYPPYPETYRSRADPRVFQDTVDQPFLLIRHPKIIEPANFLAREYIAVIGLVLPQ
ncbi:hypothetical protein C8J57DRAFT_1251815 [Mycena rebaudengoi]|nr:hypothetical protein C8J57DRAFT_1251815 [Mycena rebaudengoi]